MDKRLKSFFRGDNLLPDFLIAVSFIVVAVPLWFFLHFWSLAIFAVLLINLLIIISHYKKSSVPFLGGLIAKEYERIKAWSYLDRKNISVRAEINYFKLMLHLALRIRYDLATNYFKFLHHLALLFRSSEDNHKILIDWQEPLGKARQDKEAYIKLGKKWPGHEEYLQRHAALFQAQKRRALRFSTRGSLALIIAVFALSIVFAPQSYASTSSWIQSNWSGGASTVSVAVNPGDKTTWFKYYSKDAAIEASSSVAVNTVSTQTTYTTTADFSANTSVNALAATNSIAMLKPGAARCTKGVECVSGLCVSGVCVVQRIWTGAVNSDMNNPANYSGSGALLTTDDLIFNSGSVAATASADLKVGSISLTKYYTGNWSIAGKNATTTNNTGVILGGKGTITLGNNLTFTGASSDLYASSTAGTITATACNLVFNGATETIHDNKGLTVNSVTVGANDGVTISTTGPGFNIRGATTLVTVGSGGTFSVINIIYLIPTASQTIISLPASYTISGSSSWYIQPATTGIIYIPALTWTGGHGIIMYSYGYNTTINLSGNVAMGGGYFYIYSYDAYTMTFNTKGYSYSGADFKFGGSQAGAGMATFNASSSAFTTSGFSTYNVAASTMNLQSSTWTVNGSWTNGTNLTVNPGTSAFTFANTATITSAGKSFYAVNVNASGKTITLADDMTVGGTCGNYNVLAGTVNLNGHTVVNGNPCP